MDPTYGTESAGGYGGSREDGRGHRREYDDRERGQRRGGEERGHRDHRDRGDRGDRGDRDRGEHREYRDYDRGGHGGHGGRDDRGGYDRRRRREDDYGDMPPPRRARHDEDSYAQPMRGDYDYPRRDDNRGRPRDGGGRSGGGGGGRKASPPRSPTPEGTIPLERRYVERSMWDYRPKQYEGIGAMEAKMTGMFSYGPGRNPPPNHLNIPQSINFYSFPFGNVVNANRAAKRVYIADPTEALTEDVLKKRFSEILKERGWKSDVPGDAVIEVGVDLENKFAYVEFRTPDEALSALALDGEEIAGVKLTIKETKEFIGIDPALGDGGSFGDPRPESMNKLFIGGLPPNLNEDQILELLRSFGEVKTFNLVKDGEASRGFAFAEYIDSATTEMAIAGLNHFQLGDRTLTVSRADTSKSSTAVAGMGMVAQSILAQSSSSRAPPPASRVMLLLNMVTTEELRDDDDYADIVEDIKEECGKFGEIEGVRIPRPQKKDKKWSANMSGAAMEARNRMLDDQNGVGRVYVKYASAKSTGKAMESLGGRQFAGRTILVASVPERDFDLPEHQAPVANIEGAPETNGAGETHAPAPAPVPTAEELEQAAADALKDIMG